MHTHFIFFSIIVFLCCNTTQGLNVSLGLDLSVTSPCKIYGLRASYDAIVVGGGLGGSVAARRLAESNPSWKILLIERGGTYENCVGCSASSNANLAQFDATSGDYLLTDPQPQLQNTAIPVKDTAVQGGASSTNAMLHVRTDAQRFFSKYWPSNWNWQSMIPFYKKYENYTFPSNFHKTSYSYAESYRGNNGPVSAVQLDPTELRVRFLNSLKTVFPNMPVYYNTSLNDGYNPGIGAAIPEVTATGPSRVSAYTSYIKTYTGVNLKQITGVLASKIVFDSNKQVTGVKISLTAAAALLLGLPTDIVLDQCVVSSKKVIVSAGALGTPKLLKLSGIGNPLELRPLGIPVVSAANGVGENLRDHLTFNPLFTNGQTVVPFYLDASNVQGYAYYAAEDNGGDNNFDYHLVVVSPTTQVFVVGRTNLHASGTVKLISTDPAVQAAVDPRYFGVPSDKTAAGIALFKARQVAALLGIVPFADPCLVGLNDCSTPNGTLQAYINEHLFVPGYHFTSTASICNVTNPISLRVNGTRGLYVLDASIMPYSPAGNTQSSLYAVSERGISMIIQNMKLSTAQQNSVEAQGWRLCPAVFPNF